LIDNDDHDDEMDDNDSNETNDEREHGIDEDLEDPILIFIAVKNLVCITAEEFKDNDTISSFSCYFEFIDKSCRAVEEKEAYENPEFDKISQVFSLPHRITILTETK